MGSLRLVLAAVLTVSGANPTDGNLSTPSGAAPDPAAAPSPSEPASVPAREGVRRIRAMIATRPRQTEAANASAGGLGWWADSLMCSCRAARWGAQVRDELRTLPPADVADLGTLPEVAEGLATEGLGALFCVW